MNKNQQNKQHKHQPIFIAYYRVSTKKQSIGLTAQQTMVKNYLKDKYPPTYTFTEKESGKKSNRPELLKALDLCKKKERHPCCSNFVKINKRPPLPHQFRKIQHQICNSQST